MNGLHIKLRGWQDGEYKEQALEETDRWTIHSADEVDIEMAGVSVILKQKPKAINATRMGVGACLWEGELLLAAYLASLPTYRYIGTRVLELGAGPGLVGLLLAKMGAKVVITDIAKVLPLVEENIEANALGPQHRKIEGSGYAEAAPLEWGAPGYESACQRLASEPIDWVLAADCCYIDQEGTSPSTPHFVRACKLLCGPSTRCLVSFELRSSEVKRTFLEEAGKEFPHVTRVPTSALPKGCQVDHIELYELRL